MGFTTVSCIGDDIGDIGENICGNIGDVGILGNIGYSIGDIYIVGNIGDIGNIGIGHIGDKCPIFFGAIAWQMEVKSRNFHPFNANFSGG